MLHGLGVGQAGELGAFERGLGYQQGAAEPVGLLAAARPAVHRIGPRPGQLRRHKWHTDGRVTTIDALVVGGESKVPTGISLNYLAGITSRSPQ